MYLPSPTYHYLLTSYNLTAASIIYPLVLFTYLVWLLSVSHTAAICSPARPTHSFCPTISSDIQDIQYRPSFVFWSNSDIIILHRDATPGRCHEKPKIP
ncbi:hypothetical protein BDW72DRAFT_117873 [Aspergillus terricola var. indicus]